MIEKTLTKYKITAMVLLVVSIVFWILQKPVFNYLVLTGQETQSPMQTLTLPFFLFVIEAVLMGAYILFSNNKVISKFFVAALAVNVFSRVYSIINLIKLIVAYSNYNTEMEWVKPLIAQYTTTALISTAYLSAFVFLFIDALKKHKFLKASRMVMVVIVALSLLSVIMNFVNYGVMNAFVSSCGFLFNFALLIYYFHIAENKNESVLENELHRLKTAYESGNITDEEYAKAKQNVLNDL